MSTEASPGAGHHGVKASPSVGAALHYVGIFVVVVLVALGAHAGFRIELAGTRRFWLFVASPTLAVAAFGLVRAYRDGDLASWVKPVWGDPTRGILSAAMLVLGGLALVHVVAPAGTPREAWIARVYLQLGNPDTLREHLGLVVPAIVVVAAAEEIVWRGLVTQLLAERFGSRRAWWLAAPLYALAHTPTMWALRDPRAGLNPLVVIGALLAGLAWGAMARYFGRLTPSIISHAAFDWCVIMVFRLWGPGV